MLRLASLTTTGLGTVAYTYDDFGKLTKITRGSTWDTVYTYDNDNRPLTTTLHNGKVITNTYDKLGRISKRSIGLNTAYETNLTYVAGYHTNETTSLVATYQNGSDAAYSYSYDDNGNITEISQGTTTITYTYDSASRLTRENNGVTNQTVTYEYDSWGNILNKKIYAYTTGDLTNLTYTQIDYAYTNTTWGDQLTSYNGSTIVYDSMGNPTTYRGYAMTWRGKQLTSASNGTDTLTFEYNEDGLRQKKTVNNVDTDYFYNGSVLIGMQKNTDILRFSYNASGSVVSVTFNGTEYYYLRNAQGDIVKLIDGSGATVVEYTYDTWGKKLSITGSLASTLGQFQPFRYRGYVYDEETGLYYLQSRYYDPEVCRFISADILLSTGQGVLGHNCYAYCLGNPVNMVDPNGFDAIIITDPAAAGGYGHTSLFIQDTSGQWYYFYFGPMSETLSECRHTSAYVGVTAVDMTGCITDGQVDFVKFQEINDISNMKIRGNFATYVTTLYYEGDYSASYEYALALEQDKSVMYDLFDHNCLKASLEVLAASIYGPPYLPNDKLYIPLEYHYSIVNPKYQAYNWDISKKLYVFGKAWPYTKRMIKDTISGFKDTIFGFLQDILE